MNKRRVQFLAGIITEGLASFKVGDTVEGISGHKKGQTGTVQDILPDNAYEVSWDDNSITEEPAKNLWS